MTDKERSALLARARKRLERTTQGHVQFVEGGKKGSEWKGALADLSRLARDLEPKSHVPSLGPIMAGGKSVLDHDLTHATGGLDGYPAFDDAFRAGLRVIAPEPLTITRLSSARRRDGRPNGKAVYATGASGLLYWFAHLEQIPALGAKLRKGQTIGVVSSNHEEPHAHVGVNARPLTGRELVHHTNYTHGAPKIGAQLRKALG